MTFRKDPDARLDYVWDWSAWLPDGDTITGHTVTTDTGLTVDTTTATTTTVAAWIEGGTPGTDYQVTCRITTTAGREDDRTIRIRVADR